jgi:hypothetical protein
MAQEATMFEMAIFVMLPTLGYILGVLHERNRK